MLCTAGDDNGDNINDDDDANDGNVIHDDDNNYGNVMNCR